VRRFNGPAITNPNIDGWFSPYTVNKCYFIKLREDMSFDLKVNLGWTWDVDKTRKEVEDRDWLLLLNIFLDAPCVDCYRSNHGSGICVLWMYDMKQVFSEAIPQYWERSEERGERREEIDEWIICQKFEDASADWGTLMDSRRRMYRSTSLEL